MRIPSLAIVAALVACGGSTEPSALLPLGTYSIFVSPSNPNLPLSWRGSWPEGLGRTDCPLIGGSITILDASNFTELRDYGSSSGDFSLERSLPGTYRYDVPTSSYILIVDGGTDTVSLAGTVINSVNHEELIARRSFPPRGSCATGGPYDMSYVK